MFTPLRRDVGTPRKHILRTAKKLAKEMCWDGEDTSEKASLLAEFAVDVMPKSRQHAKTAMEHFIVQNDWHHNDEDIEWTSEKLDQFIDDLTGKTEDRGDDNQLLFSAMSTLSQQQDTRREAGKVKDRARDRVKGHLKGQGILELARFLKSAMDEFFDDYGEAASFVQETSTVVRQIKLPEAVTGKHYRKLCLKVLEHAYPQLHHMIGKAAGTLAPQDGDESVQSYVERCKEDTDVLTFSMKCTKTTKRERHTLVATAISAAIDGLQEDLRGSLQTKQREQLMQNETCTWNDIRIKAGAREEPHSDSRPTKKTKFGAAAPAAAAPIIKSVASSRD